MTLARPRAHVARALALALAGCGEEAPLDAPDVAPDVAHDVAPDVALDTAPAEDAALDTAPDVATPDAPRDVAMDAPRDVAMDAPRDVAVDRATPPDAGLAVPASLVRLLSQRPYVEGSCRPVRWRSWPYEAQRCTYGAGLVVTVANPSPERAARWIADAATRIATVSSLRTRDPATWEACLLRMGRHMMSQSSRIFPLEGQVDEGTIYNFLMGVTYGAGSGTGFCSNCYCRINSTTRAQWCNYQAAQGGAGASRCLSGFGGATGWNDAWAAHCLANHQASWMRDENPHFRAQAWAADNVLRARYADPTRAPAAAVLAEIERQYPVF